MTLTPQQKQSLQEAARAAVLSERATGCPAELTIVQWSVESNWGASQPGNNAFGIKSLPGAPSQLLRTTEWFTDHERDVFLAKGEGRTLLLKHPGTPPNAKGRREYSVRDLFATFPDLKSCFDKHGSLIANGLPYKKAFDRYRQDRNVINLIEGIAPHYATAPNYASILRSRLANPDVQEALVNARA